LARDRELLAATLRMSEKNGGKEQLLSLLGHLPSLIQMRSLLHLIDYDFSRFDQQIRSVIFCLAGGLSKNTNS